MGPHLDSGQFFSKPEMLSRQDIPSNQMNYPLVLQAVNRAHMDIGEEASESKRNRPSASACCAI
jgi:hypothetical protein